MSALASDAQPPPSRASRATASSSKVVRRLSTREGRLSAPAASVAALRARALASARARSTSRLRRARRFAARLAVTAKARKPTSDTTPSVVATVKVCVGSTK